ncbi:response regulator transcription factor [Pseudomaricurvus alkylphenolicus]|uniref:response regulator transcription factor n=1 Tax=Pseudomaricurvus alkylphenolicus TaxID=1306991 RepID=UPI00141DDC16|nr:response regulator transcription factor [Pseudomaricurvus alkylphenolicus]NIB41626.1 response regulator transcription factor [Pseudomaricurvus alkylphenolicus]
MERKLNLLIVEDEPAIRTGLVDVFVFHGFEVEFAEDGNTGLTKALSGRFDMILLDIMLPGIDGYEICRRIREQDRDQPIIMLTAKSSDEEIIQGLTLGADDYVAKPFSVAQLVLRVQSVLRRSRALQEQQNRLQLGDTSIDLENLNGCCGDRPLAFTRREIEVLQYLLAHSERPVPREELLNKVWGYDRTMDIETRTVDIHIAKLRRKLEMDPKHPKHLVTVRGAGYRLVVD